MIKIVDCFFRKTGCVVRTRPANYGGISAGKSTACLLCTGGYCLPVTLNIGCVLC